VSEEVDPVVGHWYKRVDENQTFAVIGIDEDEGIIEIQHVDGDIEEIDTDAWADMELEPTEEPDEWRGALDLDYDEDEDEDDEDDDDDEEDEDEEDDEDDDWRERDNRDDWDDGRD